MKSNLWIVDDEESIRTICSSALEDLFNIETFKDASEALLALNSSKPDLIITDIRMPGLSGLELLQAHVTMIPNAIVQLENAHATQALRLLDNIEELEDIQQVFTNADFSEEALEKYGNM